jgi:hypothetical protein
MDIPVDFQPFPDGDFKPFESKRTERLLLIAFKQLLGNSSRGSMRAFPGCLGIPSSELSICIGEVLGLFGNSLGFIVKK